MERQACHVEHYHSIQSHAQDQKVKAAVKHEYSKLADNTNIEGQPRQLDTIQGRPGALQLQLFDHHLGTS